MSEDHGFDRWARDGIARQRGYPRWQKLTGNFGFGFIFVGALANMALFSALVALDQGIPTLYCPWWLIYLIVCCITGWCWRLHGRLMDDA